MSWLQQPRSQGFLTFEKKRWGRGCANSVISRSQIFNRHGKEVAQKVHQVKKKFVRRKIKCHCGTRSRNKSNQYLWRRVIDLAIWFLHTEINQSIASLLIYHPPLQIRWMVISTSGNDDILHQTSYYFFQSLFLKFLLHINVVKNLIPAAISLALIFLHGNYIVYCRHARGSI